MSHILYSDNDIAVAVKPCGVSSQACRDGASLINMLREDLGGEIYPVHRLDRETSGIIVYARTPGAAHALTEELQNSNVEKVYLAITLGAPREMSGEYRDLLYHDARRNKSYVVSCARRGVREASLRYRTVEIQGSLSLVAVRLQTGRTHQIRVQFASRGTPIFGDRRYGGKPDDGRWGDVGSPPPHGIALASVFLSFSHPTTGERMSFTYPPSGSVFDCFDIDQAMSSLIF